MVSLMNRSHEGLISLCYGHGSTTHTLGFWKEVLDIGMCRFVTNLKNRVSVIFYCNGCAWNRAIRNKGINNN